MSRKKTIKVNYLTLRKDVAFGQSTGFYEVEIDKRLKGKKLLEILIHECFHELFPDKEEEEIEYKAAVLARTLWKEDFRRVDHHDKDKMQDDA